MRRRVAVVALFIFASGCFLFPSLDGLTGDGGAPDAPVNPPSDAGGDAPNDAVSNMPDADAAPAIDAPADAPPTAFCAQHTTATFCADFDESLDVSAGFSSTYLTDGGIVSRDTAIYSTAPAALLAGDGTLASSATSHGALVESTGVTATSSVTLDWDFRVDKLATQGSYIEALALVFQATTRSSVQLNLKAASTEVGEEIVGLDGGSSYYGHVFPAPLATGSWMHVQIALAMSAPRTITVTVGPNVVIDHLAMQASFANGPLELYLGNAYAPGPSDGASLHYDDVVLDVK